MKKQVATHIYEYNPTSENNISTGFDIGQYWRNSVTEQLFYHNNDGYWIDMFAEGYNARATGYLAHAEGQSTLASAQASHTEGSSTIASGDSSHAEGSHTIASGYNSHAEGNYTQASGYYSHAEGSNTQASGYNSHAEGNYTQASGYVSHAEGSNTIASGSNSHAEGANTQASDYASHAEGSDTIATNLLGFRVKEVIPNGNDTYLVLYLRHSKNLKSDYVGSTIYMPSLDGQALNISEQPIDSTLCDVKTTTKTILLAVGVKTNDYTGDPQYVYDYTDYIGPNGDDSEQGDSMPPYKMITIAGTVIPAVDSWIYIEDTNKIAQHAEGYYNYSAGIGSHSEGAQNISMGDFSHSEGLRNNADGPASHAEGLSTYAGGDMSHSEGENTKAIGDKSHTEGVDTQAIGSASHAQNAGTISSGYAAHAQGNDSIASGSVSHAQGIGTIASGDGSHSEGEETLASGEISHASGFKTIASGNYAYSEGHLTKAVGEVSHAQGYDTYAYSRAAHAEGYQSMAGVLVYPIIGWSDNYILSDNTILDGSTIDIFVNGQLFGLSSNPYMIIRGSLDYPDDLYTSSDKSVINSVSIESGGQYDGLLKINIDAPYQYTDVNNMSNKIDVGRYIHIFNYTSDIYAPHAEGYKTAAFGDGAHSEGVLTLANNDGAHAEGTGTQASGNNAHSEGETTIASGNNSHAGGKGTIADEEAMTAIGKYNDTTDDNTLFAVGNGTGTSNRSNALQVFGDGTLRLPKYGTANTLAGFDVSGNIKQINISGLTSSLELTTGNTINVKVPYRIPPGALIYTPWSTSTDYYHIDTDFPVTFIKSKIIDSHSLNIDPTGTKYFYYYDGNINYAQMPAFDITNIGIVEDSINIGNITWFTFSKDGLKLYASKLSPNRIEEYSLSTAWDINTISAVVNTLNLPNISVTCPVISRDGLSIYYVNFTDPNSTIYQYSLPTQWSLSGATLVNTEILYSTNKKTIQSVSMSDDGLQLNLSLFYQSDSYISTFSLSTPFDISTLSFVEDNLLLKTNRTYVGTIHIDYPTGHLFYENSTRLRQADFTPEFGETVITTGITTTYTSGITTDYSSGVVCADESGYTYTVTGVTTGNTEALKYLSGVNTGDEFTKTTITGITSGSTILYTIDKTISDSAHTDYSIHNVVTNAKRAGTLISVWDDTSIEINEVKTNDLNSSTTDFVLTMDVSDGLVRLISTTTSDIWDIKLKTRII